MAGVDVLFLMFLQFHLLSRVVPGKKHLSLGYCGKCKHNCCSKFSNISAEQSMLNRKRFRILVGLGYFSPPETTVFKAALKFKISSAQKNWQ